MTGVIRGWSKELCDVHSSVAEDMEFVENKWILEVKAVFQISTYIYVKQDGPSCKWWLNDIDGLWRILEVEDVVNETRTEYFS